MSFSERQSLKRCRTGHSSPHRCDDASTNPIIVNYDVNRGVATGTLVKRSMLCPTNQIVSSERKSNFFEPRKSGGSAHSGRPRAHSLVKTKGMEGGQRGSHFRKLSAPQNIDICDFISMKLEGKKPPEVLVRTSRKGAKLILYEKLVKAVNEMNSRQEPSRQENIGPVVAIVGESCPAYSMLVLASLHAGACVQPIDFHDGKLGCDAFINISQPAILVITTSILEKQSPALIEIERIYSAKFILAFPANVNVDRFGAKIIVDLIYYDHGAIAAIHLLAKHDFPTSKTPDDSSETSEDLSDENSTKAAFIMNTYDNEGEVKCVLLTHQNVVAALRSILDIRFSPLITANDIVINMCPFSQIIGLMLMLAAVCLSARMRCVPITSNVGPLIKAIESIRACTVYLMPTMLHHLLQDPEAAHKLNSLRRIVTYNIVPSWSTCETLRQRLPGVALRHCFGMPQTCGTVIVQTVRHSKFGWHNEILNGVEVLLATVQVPPWRQRPFLNTKERNLGRIYVRGLNVMFGYLGDPEATDEAIDDEGWYNTKYVGYRNTSGEIVIENSSTRDVFWCRGFEVSPLELETIIKSHPEVKDVAVLGVPDILGDVPRAYIVPKSAHISEASIRDFVKQQVASHKNLRGGVRFTKQIPRQGNGPEMRQKLRKLFLTPSQIMLVPQCRSTPQTVIDGSQDTITDDLQLPSTSSEKLITEDKKQNTGSIIISTKKTGVNIQILKTEDVNIQTEETEDVNIQTQETDDSKIQTQETDDSKIQTQETDDSKIQTQETDDSKIQTQETDDFKIQNSTVEAEENKQDDDLKASEAEFVLGSANIPKITIHVGDSNADQVTTDFENTKVNLKNIAADALTFSSESDFISPSNTYYFHIDTVNISPATSVTTPEEGESFRKDIDGRSSTTVERECSIKDKPLDHTNYSTFAACTQTSHHILHDYFKMNGWFPPEDINLLQSDYHPRRGSRNEWKHLSNRLQMLQDIVRPLLSGEVRDIAYNSAGRSKAGTRYPKETSIFERYGYDESHEKDFTPGKEAPFYDFSDDMSASRFGSFDELRLTVGDREQRLKHHSIRDEYPSTLSHDNHFGYEQTDSLTTTDVLLSPGQIPSGRLSYDSYPDVEALKSLGAGFDSAPEKFDIKRLSREEFEANIQELLKGKTRIFIRTSPEVNEGRPKTSPGKLTLSDTRKSAQDDAQSSPVNGAGANSLSIGTTVQSIKTEFEDGSQEKTKHESNISTHHDAQTNCVLQSKNDRKIDFELFNEDKLRDCLRALSPARRNSPQPSQRTHRRTEIKEVVRLKNNN